MKSINNFIVRIISGAAFFIILEVAYRYSLISFCALLSLIFLEILLVEWPRLLTCELNWKILFLTIIYPVIPMASLLTLTIIYYETSPIIPLYPLLIAWFADTGGYVMGKLIGTHKIYPTISPGKSWEGLVGSFIAVILCNTALVYILPAEQQISFFAYFASMPLIMIIISAIQTLVAFLGGTLISILKRKRGVKDTGSLIPGHGGLLDRFDSVFFVVMLIWIMLGSFYP